VSGLVGCVPEGAKVADRRLRRSITGAITITGPRKQGSNASIVPMSSTH
jgi:hypothetical protein